MVGVEIEDYSRFLGMFSDWYGKERIIFSINPSDDRDEELLSIILQRNPEIGKIMNRLREIRKIRMDLRMEESTLEEKLKKETAKLVISYSTTAATTTTTTTTSSTGDNKQDG